MKKELIDKYNIPIHLKYVPTDQNPADLLTRGLSLESLKKNFEFWVRGPKWLSQSTIVWPYSDLNCLSKASKSVVLATIVDDVSHKVGPLVPPIGPLVPFEKFIKYNQLLAVTSLVMQACVKFKYLSEEKMTTWWGSTDYLHCSRIHLLQIMQQQCFLDEIEYLKDPKGKHAPDLVNNLNLFIDNSNLLRSDGRIGKTRYFEEDIINPIVLAKEHPLTRRIVEDCHRKCKHLGIQSTLNQVRLSGFWIPKPYQSIKKILAICTTCKKFNSIAFKYPRVTNLPKHRVDLIKPFKHLGLDYTGHIFVRQNGKNVKMYILLFTCLSIRAIHIELLPDMTANQFVLALIRFTNHFGIPSHIYSDNDRSIIAGTNLVSQVFLSSEFKENFDKFNIKHVRIPLYSPWVGATWERCIKTVKCCLAKTLHRVVPSYFRLLTVLSDIQLAINSRPLTYRCAQDSSLEIISPNCFIRPHTNANMLFRNLDENISRKPPPGRAELLKSIEVRDQLFDSFRKVWYETYLLGMRQLYKDLHEVKFVNRIRMNEVVLIKDTKKKRQHWLLGRVVELFPGNDGKVRAVKLWRGDRKFAIHSLKHLFPVELSVTHSHIAKNAVQTNVLNEGSGLDVVPGSTVLDTVPRINDLDAVQGSSELDVSENLVEPAESDSDDSVESEINEIPDNEGSSLDLVHMIEDRNINLEQHSSKDDPSDQIIVEEVSETTASGRPKRKVSGRRRPMDDQFIFYK